MRTEGDGFDVVVGSVGVEASGVLPCIFFVGEDVGREFGACCAACANDVGVVLSAEEELCNKAEGCEHDVWCF